MNARVPWVLGALLVSPAWSQEPGFDLKSAALKDIVRATATTQINPVQPDEKKVAHTLPELAADISMVESPLVVNDEAMPVLAPAPASALPKPLSALIDALLDVDDAPLQVQPDKWLSCQWRDTAVPSCPAVSLDPMSPPATSLTPVAPGRAPF